MLPRSPHKDPDRVGVALRVKIKLRAQHHVRGGRVHARVARGRAEGSRDGRPVGLSATYESCKDCREVRLGIRRFGSGAKVNADDRRSLRVGCVRECTAQMTPRRQPRRTEI